MFTGRSGITECECPENVLQAFKTVSSRKSLRFKRFPSSSVTISEIVLVSWKSKENCSSLSRTRSWRGANSCCASSSDSAHLKSWPLPWTSTSIFLFFLSPPILVFVLRNFCMVAVWQFTRLTSSIAVTPWWHPPNFLWRHALKTSEGYSTSAKCCLNELPTSDVNDQTKLKLFLADTLSVSKRAYCCWHCTINWLRFHHLQSLLLCKTQSCKRLTSHIRHFALY